uniref:protein ENL isoform X2 n=1 Tax=Myodes glareolus TaxID=447135 RepID=UPI00201FC55C|nr:protein ENL isoform X2 [Myodes glareolus]
MVFVRGPEQCDIQHFVEKVIFRLHDSFPKPKRVCKEPPYKVEESGYAGFIMLIEVYFKNKGMQVDCLVISTARQDPSVNGVMPGTQLGVARRNRGRSVLPTTCSSIWRATLLSTTCAARSSPSTTLLQSFAASCSWLAGKEQTGVHHCHSQAASSAQLGLVRLWPGVICTSWTSQVLLRTGVHKTQLGTHSLRRSLTSVVVGHAPVSKSQQGRSSSCPLPVRCRVVWGIRIPRGQVMVMPEGVDTVSRPSPDYPMLPTIPLSAFSDPKKNKPSHGSKDANKEGGKASKPHKVAREHRERPRKDSESRSCSKEPEREPKSAKDAVRKLPKEEKAPAPKAAFKEPKMALKETKLESLSPKGAPQPPTLPKASSKRPAATDSPKPSAKKPKKSGSKGTRRAPGTSPRASSSFPDKKVPRDKSSSKGDKGKADSEAREAKRTQQADDSNSEDEASFRSESAQSSPANASSSSDSSSDSDFEPSQNHSQGPLRSMVEDLQSEESDEDDSSSGEETTVKANPGRESRLSFSDSESDNSADSCLPGREPPHPQKPPPPSSKVSGRRSPEPCSKPEKILKKATYDKAYTDELVELHRRLMALRERNVLQQTGHFNVTNTTFDFDLFSLDESTVRKLQSCLEAVAT